MAVWRGGGGGGGQVGQVAAVAGATVRWRRLLECHMLPALAAAGTPCSGSHTTCWEERGRRLQVPNGQTSMCASRIEVVHQQRRTCAAVWRADAAPVALVGVLPLRHRRRRLQCHLQQISTDCICRVLLTGNTALDDRLTQELSAALGRKSARMFA